LGLGLGLGLLIGSWLILIMTCENLDHNASKPD